MIVFLKKKQYNKCYTKVLFSIIDISIGDSHLNLLFTHLQSRQGNQNKS